ncbi:hypothetical protein E4K10_49645 [Streptomyces sp. T1317-0309]|nr:hypothetical protein E4K10_49645 [Streptomyces sp. T1317-0309]
MADVKRYVTDYTAPGARRAGLELFRASEKDAADNRRVLPEKGKLKMAVLGLGGPRASFFLWPRR